MRRHALSLGSEIGVWAPRTGVVHSIFAQAVNLLIGDDLWTLLAAARLDAPLGIRLEFDAAGLGLNTGDPVDVRAGFLRAGSCHVDCRVAARWSPELWGRPVSGLAVRVAFLERIARPRAWAESAAMASNVMRALQSSDTELASAVRRVLGRGPGLTPAGDDVLVGILALLTSGAAGEAGFEAASRIFRAMTPLLPTTPDISRHLLEQAARALPSRSLHELGRAVCAGVSHELLSEAIDRVLEVGATSGADACLGLAAAFRSSFLVTQMAAA